MMSEQFAGVAEALVDFEARRVVVTHLHPLAGDTPGRIEFEAELDAPGSYRLFLQFKVAGRVHTAPFTVEVHR